MTRKYRAGAAAAACAVLALGVTGCGGDDEKSSGGSSDARSGGNGIEQLSAKEIADKGENAFASAKSVRMRIDGKLNGQKATGDFVMDSGGNCRDTMSVGSAGSWELVRRGDRIWLKPDAAIAKQLFGPGSAAATQKYQGKYIQGTASDKALNDMADGCDMKSAQKQVDSSEGDKWTKGGSVDVGGRRAIAVKGTSDEGDPVTLYIATEGTPYVLKSEEAGDNPATVLFTDYDEPVPAETPSADQSVGIAEFQKAAGAGR
ncbi:hypothetical protein ACQUSR_30500 [Streptomyces sp. P1-3]|uniref:hypothetical protein n=1 Tax=Streptomyces sp. P1-3 TaxID=3421658 RepID=UPI003D367352